MKDTMHILAISGSTRLESTNTLFLKEISALAPDNIVIEVFHSLDEISIFNPDKEEYETPKSVLTLCDKISRSDGIIISSPEYIRNIPGGLKNAIDWLVSRYELINKPIALVHASHRGEDLLTALRSVLSTVSKNFTTDIFLQMPLMEKNRDEISQYVRSEEKKKEISDFLNAFSHHIEACES